MSDLLIDAAPGDVTPIHPLTESALAPFLTEQPPALAHLARLAQFKAKTGQVLIAPGEGGDLVLFGLGAGVSPDAMAFRALPSKLPPGDYRLAAIPPGVAPEAAALAWALGGYAYERYRKPRKEPWPRLVTGGEAAFAEAAQIARGCALARDLVNTPPNDMGPVELEMAAREVAEAHGARFEVIIGDDLLDAGYPAVHAVGRAADPKRASRMIEIHWSPPGDDPSAPLVALVGKGVVFDTGGLDLKPSSGMRLMKKDMGGAAHVLGLAHMVMAAQLPVRLVVLLPVVENAVSGDAMRPGDVIASRKGLSIEIGNTDAEGRLILADALTRAEELTPDLTLDLATLTGAARAALGPQVIPFYTADEALAAAIAEAGAAVADPVWRMPLWRGYEEALDSDIADLKNDPDAWAQAGSVTAALFLQRFAPQGAWAHFDIYAWNPKGRAGHPTGAEAQAIRALYAMLKGRYP